MTVIESKTTALNSTKESIYAFLADLNNHQQLMPENIYNWSSTVDECKFTIQNMAKLELKVSQRVENAEIKIEPVGEVPFKINLSWVLLEENNIVFAKLIINADLNPFIKIMAVGPLNKLAAFQTEKLNQIFS